MPTAAAASSPVDSLRMEFRRVAQGAGVPRLWSRLRHEWQCAADRAAARTVRATGHPGVQDDYRMAERQRVR